MSVYIQCMVCQRSSKKNLQTGQLEEIKNQYVPPEANVIWRKCAECIKKEK